MFSSTWSATVVAARSARPGSAGTASPASTAAARPTVHSRTRSCITLSADVQEAGEPGQLGRAAVGLLRQRRHVDGDDERGLIRDHRLPGVVEDLAPHRRLDDVPDPVLAGQRHVACCGSGSGGTTAARLARASRPATITMTLTSRRLDAGITAFLLSACRSAIRLTGCLLAAAPASGRRSCRPVRNDSSDRRP